MTYVDHNLNLISFHQYHTLESNPALIRSLFKHRHNQGEFTAGIRGRIKDLIIELRQVKDEVKKTTAPSCH